MTEEPYALVQARTGLWEPWAGKRPGPPGPERLHLRPDHRLANWFKVREQREAIEVPSTGQYMKRQE
jgi:hypothetical protein